MGSWSLHKILKEAFEYPDAGVNAQPEVQKAIERWRALPDEEKESQPLLYWLLGDGTPPYKMSKKDSQYTDKSTVRDQRCANCQFAYQNNSDGNYICSQIRDDIKPLGWCKLWKIAENSEFENGKD